jgi:two-component sensor histidine kinase
MTAKQRAFDYAELLLKELHHRVKNNLQTITSIMRLQSRKVTDPSVSAIISESRSRLEAMSMIHQQLYRTDNVKIINIRFFIDDLIEKIKFTYGFHNTPLDVQIDIENENLDVDMALPLGLILNELLTNSCKYAYPSVPEPSMRILIDKNRFYYTDNGCGLPPNFEIEKSDSFGMHLIVTLAQQLRTKYRFYNDNGLAFEMIFN